MTKTKYINMHGSHRMTLREAQAALETITDALACANDESRLAPARRARDKLAGAVESAKHD